MSGDHYGTGKWGVAVSVEMREGIWKSALGQRFVITRNPRPLHGKNWTDGLRVYSDNGEWESGESRHNLVEYLGPVTLHSMLAERTK